MLRRGNEGVAECKGRARSGTWQALSLWRWRCHLPVPGTCCPACCEKPDDASTSPHVPLYLPYLHRPTLFSKPKFWKNRLFSVSPSSEHPDLASSPIRHQSCYRSGPQHLLLRTVTLFRPSGSTGGLVAPSVQGVRGVAVELTRTAGRGRPDALQPLASWDWGTREEHAFFLRRGTGLYLASDAGSSAVTVTASSASRRSRCPSDRDSFSWERDCPEFSLAPLGLDSDSPRDGVPRALDGEGRETAEARAGWVRGRRREARVFCEAVLRYQKQLW